MGVTLSGMTTRGILSAVSALALVAVLAASDQHPVTAAAVASTAPTSSPTAECPGTSYDRVSREAMFCRESHPPRAEGPYYINFVAEVDGEQRFCRTVRRVAGPGETTCRAYWPFKNPIVNAHLKGQ